MINMILTHALIALVFYFLGRLPLKKDIETYKKQYYDLQDKYSVHRRDLTTVQRDIHYLVKLTPDYPEISKDLLNTLSDDTMCRLIREQNSRSITLTKTEVKNEDRYNR